MTTDAYNEQGDLARAMGVPPTSETHPDNRCFCGQTVLIGWVVDQRVRICTTGDHVILGYAPKVYIHVENPADVIEAGP